MQMPPWENMAEVAEVCKVLDTVPSIVAPYEVDQLRARLAQVCEGKAFLLQGGDCAETFADNTEQHLLANARTHTPPGTRVESAIEVRDGQAVVRVGDDGPGIPPEIQQRVFERFTRADTSRVRAAGAASGTSTGLGLAIVAAVVEAHQGRVTVASSPGWTEFTVWLPLAPAGAPEPSATQPFSR